MAQKNTRTMRVDSNFDVCVKDILKSKPREVKTSRITLAMTRHPLFPVIKKDIIQANLI